jgi:DNA repair protein RecO (recombination protein O)
MPATGNEQQVMRGSTLLALNGQGTLDELGLREARELTRRVLAHYLGDRPLKSRELFQALSRS